MKKDEIKQKRPFAPGIQWQLMLFIGGITLFTLLLVWGIITYALEPQYNRNIRAKLDSKAAAECLLRTLRAYRPTRLVAVFGCGGARSRLRRFGMGSVCARLADFCIITEDNSRGEPVEHILADIRAGLRLGNPATPFAEIPDRRQAIYYALDHAQPGDIIAILGKGHETTIERGGIKEPFVEREIVEEYWGR